MYSAALNYISAGSNQYFLIRFLRDRPPPRLPAGRGGLQVHSQTMWTEYCSWWVPCRADVAIHPRRK
jgi:hypothetical protein